MLSLLGREPGSNGQQQWGFRQFLPFSWTTLRDKHCQHPIVIMGVVDMFGHVVFGLLVLVT